MGVHGSVGGHTHAHPSPEADLTSLLFPDVALDVHLSGSPVRSDAADVYCPQVRRSAFTNAHAVNHMDVVSCWKGLSLHQASEVIMWERFHNEALVGQVSDALRAQFLRGLPSTSYSISFKSLLMENISFNNTRFVQVDVQRLVHDMTGLLYQRAPDDQTQSMSPWFTAGQNLPTMVFNFIRTRDYYLEASPKCYVQVTLSYTVLTTSLNITGMVNWHPPTVEFLALPISLSPGEEYYITPEYVIPELGTSGFPMLPTEVEFSVSSNKLPVRWDSELRCFRALVPSVTTAGILGIKDIERGDARGRQFLLDLYGASPKVSSAETILTAIIIMNFPDNVRFERLTRYNIKLAITEPEAFRSPKKQSPFSPVPELPPSPTQSPRWQPSLSNTPTSHYGDGPRKEEPTKSPCYTSRESKRDSAQDLANCMRSKIDDANSFRKDQISSNSKRKASKQFPTRSMFEKGDAFEENTRLALDKFEHVDLELTAKRQKVDQRIDSGVQMPPFAPIDGGAETASSDGDVWMDEDDLGNFTTNCLGNATAHAAPSPGENSWAKRLNDASSPSPQLEQSKSRAYEACLEDSKVMPSLRKNGSVKRIVFPRSPASSNANAPSKLTRGEPASPRTLMPEQKAVAEEAAAAGSNAVSPLLNQAAIQRNYMDFLRSSAEEMEAAVAGNEDDEQREFERIFLGGDDGSCVGEEWDTDTEADDDDATSVVMKDGSESGDMQDDDADVVGAV